MYFSKKDEYVIQVAIQLFTQGKTIEGFQMAKMLNANFYYSNAGTPYVPDARGKGTYLNGLAYRLKKAGRFYEAGAVENAFTKKGSKTLLWEKGNRRI